MRVEKSSGGGGVPAAAINGFMPLSHEDEDEDKYDYVLEHFASVVSPLFQNFAINAVVEGAGPGELYLTEWLPYGLPSTGWGPRREFLLIRCN